jgi:hypothetical protein
MDSFSLGEAGRGILGALPLILLDRLPDRESDSTDRLESDVGEERGFCEGGEEE